MEQPGRRLGVYTTGAPGDMSRIARLEARLGRRLDLVMWYEHWAGPWSAFRAADFRAVIDHGATPVITWMSDDPGAPDYPSPAGQRAFANRALLSGRLDDHVRGWARGLRDLGARVLLRFDHEMNGNWYSWSPGVNGNTPGDFVGLWRHVHAVFDQEGATNVAWVWSPNVDFPGAWPMADCYPGDDVVDWLALDGYNWGPDADGHRWQSFTDVFAPSYDLVQQVSSKPLMIAETSSVEVRDGGPASKATWIASALEVELAAHFPRVRALIWFDEDDGGRDFRIGSSDASLTAWTTSARASFVREE